MRSRVWGMWEASAEAGVPCPLEWWPSQTVAREALRERQAVAGLPALCRARYADGRQELVRFAGSERSVIWLYYARGEPGPDVVKALAPYALLSFGPRKGVRYVSL